MFVEQEAGREGGQMTMHYYTEFTTPFCNVILVGGAGAVSRLHLDTGEGKRTFTIRDNWVRKDNEFSAARREIEEYCRGNLTRFSVPVMPEGTEFQRCVWDALQRIPYGEVRSYKDIAKAIGNEKGSRAVGMANGKNPVPLIIPCHRVIGSDGSLGGFAHGLDIKMRLLEFEKQHKEPGSMRD